jgi:hypothetical protein
MKTRRRTTPAGPDAKERRIGKTKKRTGPGKEKSASIVSGPSRKNVTRWFKSVATAMGTKADKATGKAVSMVKLVGVAMRLKEHNNHLQGLYAELGRIVYEQQTRKRAGTEKSRPTGAAGYVEKITMMKKKMTLLEQEAKALKKAV